MPLPKKREGHFYFMALIQFHHNATVATAEIRNEQLDGKSWLVAPCVAIVAGVLNGLLVPADEIMISTQSWNGRSIPVHHPNTTTANEPMTIQNQVIGYFYAANFDTDRLKGEMWLDVAKAQNLGGDAAIVIETIQNGGMVEVSTAYWAYTTSQAGEFNGVPYTGITTHILPDHIAVLPGDEGACNINDGCGVPRKNQRSENMKYTMLHNGEAVELELKEFENGRKPTCHRTDNVAGMSDRDVGKALRSAVEMVTQVATDHWIWIEDVYDDYFVYEIEAKNSDAAGLWRRDYSVAADFTVTLGEASRVVRRTVYEAAPTQLATMQNQTLFNQVKTYVTNLFQNHDKERNMKEMIAAIVTNGKTGMTAEQLGQLPETAVSAMFNGLQLNEDEPEAEAETEQPAPAADPVPQVETMPAWAADLIAKVDSLTKSTNAATEQQKTAIIKKLAANERVTFTEAELKAFTLPQLEKFAATFIEPDYSGMYFGANQDTGEYEEVGLTINAKKEAK